MKRRSPLGASLALFVAPVQAFAYRPGLSYRLPGKSERHARTWMQWAAREDIWNGAAALDAVRRDLAGVARAVAQFEEVIMLVRPDQLANARQLCGPSVKLLPALLDDIWAADSGPIFVIKGEELAIVDLHFNGWGNKQVHEADAQVARQVATACAVPIFDSGIVADGGALEADGDGTLITTESTLVNENRNPGLSKAEIQRRLTRAFGLEKIIWLPGLQGLDITDGHPDAFVRFVGPGAVVAELPDESYGPWYDAAAEAIAILKAATDARGRRLDVSVMQGPLDIRSSAPEFAASYLDFHPCNGGLIMPQFGDRIADRKARETLSRLFPDRRIVQISTDRICEGGGSLHCVTRQQPVSADRANGRSQDSVN